MVAVSDTCSRCAISQGAEEEELHDDVLYCTVQLSNVAQLHGLADKPKAYPMAKLYAGSTAKSLIVIIACILSQYKPHVGMRKGRKVC
jgi:hypothetical protein